MTYRRVILRNHLSPEDWPAPPGDYYVRDPEAVDRCAAWWEQQGQRPGGRLSLLVGDLRRLEHDQRDEAHLAAYARRAGITPAQVKIVLDHFFAGCGGV